MPLIQVTMIEGRTPEEKRNLLAAITTAVQETTGASLDSIRVWIVDVAADEFMSAGVLTSERRAAADAPAAPPPGDPAAGPPGTPPAPPGDPIGSPGGSGPLP
jgi:4-oxalocrotonate tautomerase